MVSMAVESKSFLPEKGQDISTRREADFITQPWKHPLRVLVYNMHSYQKSVRLLLLYKNKQSILREHAIGKRRYNERSQHKKSQALNSITPFKSLTSSYSFTYVPLSFSSSVLRENRKVKRDAQSGSSRLFLERTSLPQARQILSASLCRLKARKQKFSLWKDSVSSIEKGQQPSVKKQALFKNDNALASTPRESSRGASQTHTKALLLPEQVTHQVKVISPERHPAKSKSIWKGVTNALMRHGRKLRYKTVLRKALLVTGT